MTQPLNAAQLAAVRTISGPLLVLAGAGTGKTRVVTHRIAELIRRGTPPERILAVTFTNRAAREMEERALALLGGALRERPEISTFHSLCVRILRRRIHHLGYALTFSIYDRAEQESAARAVLREIRVPHATLHPRDLLARISRWKSAGVRPEQAASRAETDQEHLAAMAYRRYQGALRAESALDFDDLLLCTEELFQRHPQVRREEADRFDYLLVDEYQDTNPPQYRIISSLASWHRNLCVVGDDDQSIYGWRGAEVTHILRFRQDWPDAKVVRLEENYRSTGEILQLANCLIRFNAVRHEKVLRAVRRGEKPRILQFQDENLEAQGIVDEIRDLLARGDVRPKDFAILFRTNDQPRPFETALRRRGLAYVLVGGKSFFDRAEVRDILAYLKLVARPQDEASLLRIMNRPPRGIGKASVVKLTDRAVAEGIPLWELLPRAAELEGVPAEAVKGMRALHDAISSWNALLSRRSPLAILRDVLRRIDYRAELERLYADPLEREARWQSIEQVVNALAEYEHQSARPDLVEFMDQLTLSDRDDERRKEALLNRDAIALLTLHSAKGLEFSQVYMVGMEEGLLPHHRAVADSGEAIDEERRLCYVGLTRARDRLTLSLALSRMKWGKPRETHASRFLYELTGQADHPNATRARQVASGWKVRPERQPRAGNRPARGP